MKSLKKLILLITLINITMAQDEWAVKIADSFIKENPVYISYDQNPVKQKWFYEQGLMLEAMKQMYKYTGDKKYFNYIKNNIDLLVDENGKIDTYELDEFNIDQVTPGRAVLYLFQETKESKYKTAVDTLRKQLKFHPRTLSSGFWHKKIYPYQMWLDGLYMGEPFYTEYSAEFNENNYDDIFLQFDLIYKNTMDKKSGLLYHAWDESKKQKWADPKTGKSPHFWGRSIGWYLMAVVDVLDTYPRNNKNYKKLISQFNNVCKAVLKVREPKSKLWYQVLDQHGRDGNYLEASASSMFVYAFAKGAVKGYLGKKYLKYARESFNGIIKELVTTDEKGKINLNNVCSVAGLGGNPYRDGSYEYYISEKKRTNDFKGYGPFLLAAIELEKSKKIKL